MDLRLEHGGTILLKLDELGAKTDNEILNDELNDELNDKPDDEPDDELDGENEVEELKN